MKIVIDLDGTICNELPTFERSLAKPLIGAVEKITQLKQEGNFIIIYTARGWQEFKVTEQWLKDNLIPFDLLLMGKPMYDLWLDDKAIHFESWTKV